ncbi:LysR family transcriptional regulator [Paraburkholderia phenoliruptrix]|uniref:LysR family transcriptional regulator n=1 Tax=Paraburkholderia phenoliruptrix TaxID=252970 RepID=UPI002869C193|nr:LysR family transcriptional regulator [Paraburkholderia phenoliruptrix]WMY11268.1 LysR family transcriptional regulator [Paraburkholderia phenoliruptrix]
MLEFVAVVERGTFTGAARQLGVSVSHISRQIADLEARLAAQLFVRTTRQMQLTEPGRRLFKTSQPLLEDLLRAQETILETHDAIEGTIRVSLAGKYAEEQLVPLLTGFCAEHPKVSLELDISARNVDLIAEGVHLAVRMGPLETSSSLVATRLLSAQLIVLASPALLDSLPDIRSPSSLPPNRCLPLVNRPWEFVKGKHRESVKPVGRFSSNSGAAAIQAALAGIGIVNVPSYYAGTLLDAGLLVQILQDWRSVEEAIFYLVFPAGRYMPARVRRLIEYLQASVPSR